MNSNIREFLAQSDGNRRAAFLAAMEKYGALAFFAEKDFWVCLVLDGLFNHNPGRNKELIFKGGTSLSKLYSLIQRFSEDIDLTMMPSQLGFLGPDDPTSAEFVGSGEARKRKFEEVQLTCKQHVENFIVPDLRNLFDAYGQRVAIEFEGNNEHETTLRLRYPSITEADPNGYFTSTVKLEIGVRGGLRPKSISEVSPYISEVVPGKINIGNVLAIEPQRTFWEKLIILHGQACRYTGNVEIPADRNRISRHYYDVAKIFQNPRGEEFLADADLGSEVCEHCKRTYWKHWQRLDQFIPGSFNLVPEGRLLAALEADYALMSQMIFGDVIPFKEIVETISTIQVRLNVAGPTAAI